MTEDDYLLWLSSIPNLSLTRQNILLNFFGSAHDIWYANEALLLSIPKIPKSVLQNIIKYKDEKKLLAYKNLMRQNKIQFVSKLSDDYPRLLKSIPNPPNGFYVLGQLPNDYSTKLAIVGSRKYTEYGAHVTQKLSFDLASKNIVIVSGMARGIDTIAHKSAIKACGKTIAVLGCGIDVCYPPENGQLRHYIINNGCLISEFPLGCKPFVGNFPLRNRIISGLCKGLIVVEAGEKSGTLITVGHALEQGREVMAVPGMISSLYSQGTNYLIKQGASLISSSEDVLEIIKSKPMNYQLEKDNQKSEIILANDEKLLYNIISSEPVSFDYICSKIDLPVSKLSSLLIMLEMKGIIKSMPGQKYIRNGDYYG